MRPCWNAQRPRIHRLLLSIKCCACPVAAELSGSNRCWASLSCWCRKQWDIKRKIPVNFFFLCMEKLKSIQLFKSPRESLPPGTQAPGLWEPQAALLAHGERMREKAFSSREHPSPYPCIHAQQLKLCSKWKSKKLAKILTSQTPRGVTFKKQSRNTKYSPYRVESPIIIMGGQEGMLTKYFTEVAGNDLSEATISPRALDWETKILY